MNGSAGRAAGAGDAASAEAKTTGASATTDRKEIRCAIPETLTHGVESASHEYAEEDRMTRRFARIPAAALVLAFLSVGALAGQDAQQEKAMMEAWQK